MTKASVLTARMVRRHSSGSSQLANHVARVEQYGFERKNFPREYEGHRVIIRCNHGHFEEGRLLFDFKLYCTRCDEKSAISGRFPASDDEQLAHLVNAKIAVFATFKSLECV